MEHAGKSASAMSVAKALQYQIQGMPFERAIEAGVQVNAMARMTPDFREGLAAVSIQAELTCGADSPVSELSLRLQVDRRPC